MNGTLDPTLTDALSPCGPLSYQRETPMDWFTSSEEESWNNTVDDFL